MDLQNDLKDSSESVEAQSEEKSIDQTNSQSSEHGQEKLPQAYKGSLKNFKGLFKNKFAEKVMGTVTQKITDAITENYQTPNSSIEEFEEEQPKATKIPMEYVHPCPDQPRQIFDDQGIEELAQTLREIGQAQAITVRRVSHGYEIISGERRYRAAKLAGFTHLECLVKDCTRKEARLLALVENTQRQDLFPLEEAFFLKKVFSDNPSLSLEKLAKTLGTHKSTLSEKIQLTEIPEDLSPLLLCQKGRFFTHRHWRVVSRIKDPQFLRNMLTKAVEYKMSVAELERALQAAGIKKAVRKRSVKKNALKTAQLSFGEFEWYKKTADNHYHFRSFVVEKNQMDPSQKAKLIEHLKSLIQELS